jgi:CheY-like chemotaxis protein
MPRVGGLEVLKWLRDHPECNIIPVLVLSSSKEPRDVKRAYQLRANSYIVKPSAFEDLQAMLRTVHDYWCWCEKPPFPQKC